MNRYTDFPLPALRQLSQSLEVCGTSVSPSRYVLGGAHTSDGEVQRHRGVMFPSGHGSGLSPKILPLFSGTLAIGNCRNLP